MSKQAKVLEGMEKKVAELAIGAYRASVEQAQQLERAAAQRLDADLMPLREAIGVPEGVRMNVDGGKNGTLTATWDPEDLAKPPQPSTGPIPLRVLKGKRKRA